MGLINRLAEPEELETVVRDYATRMAANAPLTMAAAKATIREGLKDTSERDVRKIGSMVSKVLGPREEKTPAYVVSPASTPSSTGRGKVIAVAKTSR